MKINCSHDSLVELHKLTPNPKNPNSHSDDQVERLAKIIDYQGQRSPIVVSNLSGFITKGHGRLLAIKMLGWESAAVDYQDYENEAQEYADIVADNSIAEWSNLDLSMINNDFVDLGPDLDLDFLGIKNFTIDRSFKDVIPDYEMLDDDETTAESMKTGVLRSIQIDFSHDKYDEAYTIIKSHRDSGLNIGEFLLEKLGELNA
jgi:hypothetical protein